MQVPGHRTGPGTRLPRARRVASHAAADSASTEPRDEISCRGHAFDEDLNCSCGVTWFEHQRRPRACRLHAQRCHRTGEEPVAPPAGGATDALEPGAD